MTNYSMDFLSRANLNRLNKLVNNTIFANINLPVVEDDRLHVTFKENYDYGYLPVSKNVCSYMGYTELIRKLYRALEKKVGSDHARIITNSVFEEAASRLHPASFMISPYQKRSSIPLLKSLLDMSLVMPGKKIIDVEKCRASLLPKLKNASNRATDAMSCFVFNDDKILSQIRNGIVKLKMTTVTAENGNKIFDVIRDLTENNDIQRTEAANLIKALLSLNNNSDNNTLENYRNNAIASSIGSDLFDLDLKIIEVKNRLITPDTSSKDKLILPELDVEPEEIILPEEHYGQQCFFDDMEGVNTPSIYKVTISPVSQRSLIFTPNVNHGFDIEAQDGDAITIETFER